MYVRWWEPVPDRYTRSESWGHTVSHQRHFMKSLVPPQSQPSSYTLLCRVYHCQWSKCTSKVFSESSGWAITPPQQLDVVSMMEGANNGLLQAVICNSSYILLCLFPPEVQRMYALCPEVLKEKYGNIRNEWTIMLFIHVCINSFYIHKDNK